MLSAPSNFAWVLIKKCLKNVSQSFAFFFHFGERGKRHIQGYTMGLRLISRLLKNGDILFRCCAANECRFFCVRRLHFRMHGTAECTARNSLLLSHAISFFSFYLHKVDTVLCAVRYWKMNRNAHLVGSFSAVYTHFIMSGMAFCWQNDFSTSSIRQTFWILGFSWTWFSRPVTVSFAFSFYVFWNEVHTQKK